MRPGFFRCFVRIGRTVVPAVVLWSWSCVGDPGGNSAPHAAADAPATARVGAVGTNRDCVEEFEPGRDYFSAKAEMRHAEQVSVEYFSHYKVVHVRRPWPGAEDGLGYLLVQCGTPRPAGYEGYTTFEIPARTLITTSTTELPHVVALGLVDGLLGHDELDYVVSPEIRRRIDSGQVLEVGSGSKLNLELVAAASPDILLMDSPGDLELGLLAKLQAMGVAVALVPSFLETSALGRAEWIKITAMFFNLEARAEESFAEVETNYLTLAEKVRREVAPEQRPTVLFGGPIQGTWYVPGGTSFVARLLADAGARYPWADRKQAGSLPLGLETVFARAGEADVWLHPCLCSSLDELLAIDERLALFSAFERGAVFNHDARVNELGGNDYWETGTARPDLVLADWVELLHPELQDGVELVFHRRLEFVDPASRSGASGH